MPDGYGSAKKYPLFMSMHGNGVLGLIDHHCYFWKPEASQDANVPCKYIITEGVGHWYPLDMPAMVEKAIAFIQA